MSNDKPNRFELVGGPGAHDVDIKIDGERPDDKNWWIENVEVAAKSGDIVTAVVTFNYVYAEIDVNAKVTHEIGEETRQFLKSLGWTPPVDA